MIRGIWQTTTVALTFAPRQQPWFLLRLARSLHSWFLPRLAWSLPWFRPASPGACIFGLFEALPGASVGFFKALPGACTLGFFQGPESAPSASSKLCPEPVPLVSSKPCPEPAPLVSSKPCLEPPLVHIPEPDMLEAGPGRSLETAPTMTDEDLLAIERAAASPSSASGHE